MISQPVIVAKSRNTGCVNHTAAHFLMRTFRNVLYVRVGKRYICCARKRSFEKARGETEDGRCLLVPEPHPLRRRHTPLVRKPNHNLNQRPPWALFCLKLDNSCCYARYSCGNICNVVLSSNSCKSTTVF